MRTIALVLLLTCIIIQSNSQGLLGGLINGIGNIFGGIFGGGGGNNIRASANAPLLANIVRNPDGSGNNLNNPNFGKVLTPFPRITFAAYADGAQRML